ncbi:MAG TPA: cysteine synthase A [Gammaproteobacteria bacterium]|jgi:cysteine synthase A|nr:MAG: cysteine synthase A [Gammaproteobacteria bacterium TMED134]RZO71964.1 MAG: cysteine synthase A [OM182 bacterium]HAL43154.1 cysteine synthase A [Gammaproteobacteria bacterium]|tara:strand:- start:1369 stop:2322 length:954 start_codon:yes stop_codon:yes gene_type:complete
MKYANILETIGNTPIVKLNRFAPDHVDMYVKVESFNPMASVKDRLAYAIMKDARDSGALTPGQTVIEATSGNTGIALAMVCAVMGHPFVAVMVETFSIERRKIMRALGAKVILTPKEEKGSGMVRYAEKLSTERGWFLARQFQNPANPAYHASTTGPEILADFAGERLDYWVTGWGTGGTLSGAGRTLKAARPELNIVAAEPEQAALLSGDSWSPHKIQGWTPDFIPEILDQQMPDQIIKVDDDESMDCALRLGREEGIFVGISAGGTLSASLKIAETAEPGSVILTMLADTAERYLSTPLFASINEGSDDDWLEST